MDFSLAALFPLEIFPQGGLTSSVITTAWVGIWVVCLFNMRFGWVLSGLIIPGYLVPLMLVNPVSAVITLIEGVITYYIVFILSEKLPQGSFWSSLFGRDRFFAMVITSVFVRIAFDVYWLPLLGQFLTEQYHFNFDYRNTFHSFGLIIVSLIANQFWKTGFVRGIGPLIIILTITFLIVRFGLMEVTNFTLSNLNYIYEDIASSILASPKAYIILISAAFIASRMNLKYGWDFNGILIPALLALQWYEPMKIVTSFVEAVVIILIANSLLKLPFMANVNIEGARKLLLFFNIGFIYKILLGHFMISFFPEVKISDAYGFGYLLSTLIAIKMHDKDIIVRLTTSTVYTSMVAVILATIIGFVLTMISPFINWNNHEYEQNLEEISLQPSGSLNFREQFKKDKVILYQSQSLQRYIPPANAQINTFKEAMQDIKKYIINKRKPLLNNAVFQLKSLDFEIQFFSQRYLYIHEKKNLRGWGMYLIDLETDNSLLISIPFPLDERGSLEAGIALSEKLSVRAVAIGGSSRYVNIDGSANVIANSNTLFHSFHQVFAAQNTLQIRSRTSTLLSDASLQQKRNTILTVKRSLPVALDIKKLKQLTTDFEINWRSLKENNLQYQQSHQGFVELDLNQKTIRRLISSQYLKEESIPLTLADKRIDGYLLEWLLEQEDRLARSGSHSYQIPKAEELLYFDEEIITPLLQIIERFQRVGQIDQQMNADLNNINAYAAAFNYSLIHYQHKKTADQYLILAENIVTEATAENPNRYWGSYVFRLTKPVSPYLLQVPRPVFEVNSYEFAVSLFEQLDAAYLIIAGTHPRANLDGSSDLVKVNNLASLFSLVNQIILRESANEQLMGVSIRAFGYRDDAPLPDEDILISHSYYEKDYQLKILDNLKNHFHKSNLSYRMVDGDYVTSGYEVAGLAQSLYARNVPNKSFAMLWLSPMLRKAYQQKNQDSLEAIQFEALGIHSREADLHLYLLSKTLHKPQLQQPNALHQLIYKYIKNQDIIILYKILSNWKNFQFERIIDRDSKQSFLVILKHQDVLGVYNLSPLELDSRMTLSSAIKADTVIEAFIRKRMARLEFSHEAR